MSVLRRLGGHPALDFVNTVDPREGDEQIEYPNSFEDLVQWAVRGRLIDAPTARVARTQAARSGSAGAGALTRAMNLREALYAIFGAIAAGRRLPRGAVAELESAWREAMAHAHLTAARPGFRWKLTAALDVVRWQIARDAVALLESDRLDRIKRCPGSQACGWLFLDASRNASRRWCSMDGCGNCAKVRRYVARHRRDGSSCSPGIPRSGIGLPMNSRRHA